MRAHLHPLFALLLGLGLLIPAAACDGVGGGEPDDDDATADDDDDDDTADDDDTGDDDDTSDEFVVTSITTTVDLQTTLVPCGAGDDDDSAGDDDDSAGDDDDSAGDDDDSAGDDDDDSAGDDDDSARGGEELACATVGAVFQTSYWIDRGNGVLNCVQRTSAEGDASLGFGAAAGCTNCTGLISLDPASVVDVSDPVGDPDDCDVAVLDAEGFNLGTPLLQPTPDGFGDQLNIALQDVAAWDALGADYAVGGGLTAAETLSQYGDIGLAVWGVGGVEVVEGSLADTSGLPQVMAPLSPGSVWHAQWVVVCNPETNAACAPESLDGSLSGEYVGVSTTVLNFAR